MLIATVGSSRNSCVASLLVALKSVPFGEVLALEVTSAPDAEIKLHGKVETALVYSFDTLTLEPLTAEDCQKLLQPFVKRLRKKEYTCHDRNFPTRRPCDDRRRLLVPSSRKSTWVMSQRSSWVFRQ
jgi:hypothetical protein